MTDGSRDVASNSFVNSTTVSQTRRDLDSEGQRWAEQAETARRTDFSHDVNLANRVANYFGERYRANDPVRDVHGEAVPIGALLNPVGPNAKAVSDLREEALRRDVYPDYVRTLKIDAQIDRHIESFSPSNHKPVGRPTPTIVDRLETDVARHLEGAPSKTAIQSPLEGGLGAVEGRTRNAGDIAEDQVVGNSAIAGRRRALDTAHETTGARRIGARPLGT